MDEPAAHFLLVGDSSDLPSLRGIISRLPVDAYGQVFIEVAAALQVQALDAPERITVTWLCRDRTAGRLPPRGALAARAVIAWVAEWVTEGDDEHELPYILWIGCPASEQIDRLYRHLAHRFGNLHMHHPHYE